ncbi:MAG: RtcB family protein, partial [Candidatus Woesearchaeota archaeon]
VGGTMGTASYILRGTTKAMDMTFGSGIHGAGREKSRMQAKKDYDSNSLIKELESKGIIIKGHSRQGISEEAPGAYKDIEKVVKSVHDSGINVKVARLRPVICIKG